MFFSDGPSVAQMLKAGTVLGRGGNDDRPWYSHKGGAKLKENLMKEGGKIGCESVSVNKT